MKRLCLACGMSLAFSAEPIFADTCSIEQRIELSKAGYEKSEIEALCADISGNAAASTQSPAVAARSPIEILAGARYDGTEEPPFSRIFHPRNRCEFLSDSVKINNEKKTFGGYYSKLLPHRKFSVSGSQTVVTPDKGVISSYISITAYGLGTAGQTCYAYLAQESDLSAADIETHAHIVRAEYDEIIAALRAVGVDIDD